ncbi:MAG: hypothetical protein AAFV29_20635, partial [Myxococcota bacterium]
NAEVSWSIDTQYASYAPPGHSKYNFGVASSWWERDTFQDVDANDNFKSRRFYAQTNAKGQHALRIDLTAIDPPRVCRMEMTAAVADVNRQKWSGSSTIVVHPSKAYVGLRLTSGFGEAGQPFDVEGIVADLDGATMANHTVTATLARLDWKKTGQDWTQTEEQPEPCATASDTNGQFRCRFTPKTGGQYRITAEVRDARGRRNMTTMTFWVAGSRTPDARRPNRADELVLIADKQTYAPGDTARVLIRAPFADAEGLLTIEREGMATTKRFTVRGIDHTLEIPIAAHHLPALNVAVSLIGQAPRKAMPAKMRPAFAEGQTTLLVDDAHRRLQVEVSPRSDKLPPGAKTTVDVRVVGADGQPVQNADVALVVVDEAILALTSAESPDPLPSFYLEHPPGVRAYRTRDRINLARPEVLSERRTRKYKSLVANSD